VAIPPSELGADDVLAAFAASQDALRAARDRDWAALAGKLDWTGRQTLNHMIDGTVFYSGQVAGQASTRLPRVRFGDQDASIDDLITTLGTVGRIFAAVLRAAPDGTRAFHPAGMADVSGYAAMSCAEILVHTADIAAGLGIGFNPPAGLPARVVRRLFPWIDDMSPNAWSVLRWTTGRIAIDGRDDVAADWYWQCAPLSEWDGTVKKRQAHPMGR